MNQDVEVVLRMRKDLIFDKKELARLKGTRKRWMDRLEKWLDQL